MPVFAVVVPTEFGAEKLEMYTIFPIQQTFYPYVLCPPAMTIFLLPRLSVTRPHIMECRPRSMGFSGRHPDLRSNMNAEIIILIINTCHMSDKLLLTQYLT